MFSNKYSVSFILIVFLFIGCDSNVTNNDEKEILHAKKYEKLITFMATEYNFPEELIEVGKSHFFIDGDMLIPIKEIRSEYDRQNGKGNELIPTQQQARTEFIIEEPNTPVSVRVDPSLDTYPNWVSTIEDAVDEWNKSCSFMELNYLGVGNSTADINIFTDTSADVAGTDWENVSSRGLVALSDAPTINGFAGDTISIDMSANLSNSERKNVIVHELGHAIGFRHTDWQSFPPEPAAIQIPNTPNVDNNSIMNRTVTNWNGLSIYDLAALRILYPDFTYDIPTARVQVTKSPDQDLNVGFRYDGHSTDVTLSSGASTSVLYMQIKTAINSDPYANISADYGYYGLEFTRKQSNSTGSVIIEVYDSGEHFSNYTLPFSRCYE